MLSKKFMESSQIHTFQVDHNSTCNLKCPQCARINNGGINENVPQKALDLDFYKKVFTKELCQSIERVFFCGNYGDVIASNNILEVCDYLKSQGLKTVSIVTNGSLRDKQWWTDLAGILNGKSDKVLFSIDGLADTNHLYRVGSNYEKIMENAQAYIDAGGYARWEYLVFAHNEHQIDEAKQKATEMGFKSFKMKKTNRFIRDKQYKSGKKEESANVWNRKREKTHEIAQPKDEKLQTKGMKSFEKIIKNYNSWDEYIEKSTITCKAQKERSLFIDFQGALWPCTWTAAPLYFFGNNNGQKKQLKQIVEVYGADFNNLHEHSLEEVLSHPWFERELTESWCGSMKDRVPKLMTSGRTCGQEYEFSSNAPENKVLEELNG